MSARDAVDRIVVDISSRRMGWDSLDDDIKDEIRGRWWRIVVAEMRHATECLRAAHERDLARAYWRGMLGPMIAEADRAAAWYEKHGRPRNAVFRDGKLQWAAHFARRAARLRAIADGPAWEPWWERRKAGA